MKAKDIMPFAKMGYVTVRSNLNKNKYKKLKARDEKEAEKFLIHKLKIWSTEILNIAKITVKVYGEENIIDETCLFASNHQSNFDIPALCIAINTSFGFVAKKELQKLPILPYWMKEIGSVFLDRENPREGLKSIIKASEYLKAGHSMAIFPEGTRSNGSEIGSFKKGSLKLALKAEVPIIPISIEGSYKVFEGNNKVLNRTPEEIKIYIGKAIYPKEMEKEDKNRIHEIIEDVVRENKEKFLDGK
ncbi:MAG: lysophospholipid acyltransferase family protein [Clostridium sp.]